MNKIDRVHVRDIFDVKAEYVLSEAEVVITFSYGHYPNFKEAVIHTRLWLISYIINQIKRAIKTARSQIEEIDNCLKTGVG